MTYTMVNSYDQTHFVKIIFKHYVDKSYQRISSVKPQSLCFRQRESKQVSYDLRSGEIYSSLKTETASLVHLGRTAHGEEDRWKALLVLNP